MEYFTRSVRGSWVCIWYEVCNEEQAVWIANVVTGKHVVSMDGLVALGTGSVAAEIARSVDRALQWATKMDGQLKCAHTLACQAAMDPGIKIEAEFPISNVSVVET